MIAERRRRAAKANRSDRFRIGVWNSRGLGAVNAGVDPEVKLRALASTWRLRNWSAVLLTDVRLTEKGSGIGIRSLAGGP